MENTTSRESILAKVRMNKPLPTALPDVDFLQKDAGGSLEMLSTVLSGVGGKLYCVAELTEVISVIKGQYPEAVTLFSPIADFRNLTGQTVLEVTDGRELEHVEIAILKGHFAVAENGAVWVTDDRMGHRALPFICQHLALIIDKSDILPTMHEAYERMARHPSKYGTFISGPSKTADIEQSLVLGAHGPQSMLLFVLDGPGHR